MVFIPERFNFFNIALVVIFVLRSRTAFMRKHGVSVLLFACLLALLRLILPLEFPFAFYLQSWSLLPAFQIFFQSHHWVLSLLLAIWGIGVVVVLIKDISALIRVHTICKSYVIVKSPRVDKIAVALHIRCPVLVSPDVSIPFVTGLFRHTIYLPDQELSDKEVELILRHETQHILSHDSQVKLIWGLLSAVLWWNPIVYKFREEIDSLLEFRCDAKVTESMDAQGRVQYLDMLLNMMKNVTSLQSHSALSLDESFALNSSCVAQQRFMIIADNLDGKLQHISLALRCILIVLFFASFLIVLQPASHPPLQEGDLLLASGQDVTDDEICKAMAETIILQDRGKSYLYISGKKNRELSAEEVLSDAYKDYIIMEIYHP